MSPKENQISLPGVGLNSPGGTAQPAPPSSSGKHRWIMKVKCTFLLVLLSVAPAARSTEVFFGEDVSPHPVDGPADVPRPADFPQSRGAYLKFVARLAELTLHTETQTFESFSSNSFYYLPSVALVTYGTVGGGIGLNYLGDRDDHSLNRVCWFREQTNTAATDAGAFPISGSKYLQVRGLTSAPRLAFWLMGEYTKAFGFFATGLRSSNVVLHVEWGLFNGQDFAVPVTAPQGPGGVCFFGLITDEFLQAELRVLSGTAEPFGIDDTMVAAPGLPTGTVPAGSATLRLDRSLWGIWIEGTVGARYRVEFSPQCLQEAVWRPFAEFVLPESPYYVQRIGITNTSSYFRAIGLNQ